jgi:hypothetical protein
MSLSWEKMQGLLHQQSVRSCGGREFSACESAYRLAYARRRNGKNHRERVEFANAVAEWFPSVKGCPVADSGKVIK